MLNIKTESGWTDTDELQKHVISKYVVRCKCNVILMYDKETQCNFYDNNEIDELIGLDENVFSKEDNENYTIFAEPATDINNIDTEKSITKCTNEYKDDFTSWNFETDSSNSDINYEDLFTVVPEYKCIKVNGGFKCEICDKISPTMAAYSSHHESHDERCNLCYACGFSAENSAKLRLHVYFYETHGRCRGHGIIKKVENCCEICNKTFPQYIKLMDHINTHTKERPYRCGCGSSFGSHSNFIVHIQKFKCSSEGRSIPTYAPSTLLGLIPLGNEEKKRKRRTAAELNKITDIMKFEHNIPTTSKKMKNEKTNERRKYVRKKGLLITNRKYICENCSKEFPSAPKLRMHHESEHMERKFTCDNCKRKFAKKRLLRVHIEQFHVEKFKCEECNLVFSKIGHKTHMQTHNIIKVKCEECDMLISTRYIRSHMDKHTGKNDNGTFYCAICKLECQFKFYKEHLKSQFHLQCEDEMKLKLNIIKFSCRRCEKIEFDNLFDYTKHHGVYHCWSVKKQLEDILKLFINFKKFVNPTVYEM